MLSFNYQAIDKEKQILKGNIQAQNERAAIRLLEQKNLEVVDIFSEQKIENTKGLSQSIKPQQLILSFYELATMLNSGVSVADAVLAQQESSLHPRLAKALEDITAKLRSGDAFSRALVESDLELPEYVQPMLEAGELTGEMGKAFSDIVEQMEYDHKIRNEIRNALIYPAILIFTGFSAVLLMFTVVVPNFSNVLEQGKDLHWLANTVLTIGMWSNDNLWLLLGSLFFSIYLIVYLLKQEKYRDKLLAAMLNIPLLGDWLIEAETARWSKLLGILLQNKVALIRALQLALTGVKTSVQKSRLQQVTARVRAGQTLSQSLEENQALTPTGYNMIRIGEKAGALPAMLLSLAKLYENAGRERMKSFLLMIEPIAIIVIGALIGLIIAGVVLAITSANDLVI